MVDRVVADRIAAGMVAAWEARVSHIEGHALYEHDGIVTALSGLPDPELSVALVEHEPSDPVGALSRAEWWFDRHGGQLGIDVELGRHPSVDRALQTIGLSLVASRPAMALAIADLEPARPVEGLAVSRVASERELAELVRIETLGFGTAPDVAARILGPSALERSDVRLFLARLDGEAVGMAYVHVHERALGVFGVATVPERRRRGIGTAVTDHALRMSSPDADLAWLQPSDMGRSVYEAMGFRAISEWQVWIRRRSHR
jgi:GNAT superfamily N-acetyltransferase